MLVTQLCWKILLLFQKRIFPFQYSFLAKNNPYFSISWYCFVVPLFCWCSLIPLFRSIPIILPVFRCSPVFICSASVPASRQCFGATQFRFPVFLVLQYAVFLLYHMQHLSFLVCLLCCFVMVIRQHILKSSFLDGEFSLLNDYTFERLLQEIILERKIQGLQAY